MTQILYRMAVVALLILVLGILLRLVQSAIERDPTPVAVVPTAAVTHFEARSEPLVDEAVLRTTTPTLTNESEDAPTTPGLLVRVVDEAGRPIVAARTCITTNSNAVVAERRTDGDGLCTIPVSWDPPFRVVASAAGFAPLAVSYSRFPDRAEVSLRRSTSLRGRVTRYDGGTLDQVTHVYAWRADTVPARQHFDLVDGGVPALAHTMCGPDGRFELPGLDPRSDYVLGAGATGWATIEFESLTPAAGTFVELRCARLFGVTVRAVSGGRRHRSMLGQITWGALDDAALFVEETSLFLSGFRDPLPRNFQDLQATVLYAAKGLPAGGHLRTRFDAVVPGYEQRQFVIDIPRLGTTLEQADLEMRRTHELGRLRLDFGSSLKPMTDLERHAVRITPVRVFLQADAPDVQGQQVSVRDVASGLDVGPIPIGRYRIRFQACGAASPRAGNALVQILPAERTTHVFPMSGLSRIRVLPPTTRRPALSGLRILVCAPGSGRGARFVFGRGPYVIDGVAPGTYDLQVSQRSAQGTIIRSTTISSVEIPSADVVEVEFEW